MSETVSDEKEFKDNLEQRRNAVIAAMSSDPKGFTIFPGEKPTDRARARSDAMTEMVLMYGGSDRASLVVAKLRDESKPLAHHLTPEMQYKMEAGNYPLLTAEQEVGLFGTFEQGMKTMKRLHGGATDEYDLEQLRNAVIAHDMIMHCNLRLVVSIAARYKAGQYFLDLVQAGNEGLEEAIARFDYRRGFKFSTPATQWIRQSISKYIRDHWHAIRMPSDKIWDVNKLRRLETEYYNDNGEYPTNEQMAAEMDKSPEYIKKLKALDRMQPRTSLDVFAEFDDNGDKKSYYEILGGATLDVTDFENKDEIDRLLSSTPLTDEEKAVISLRAGLYLDELRAAKLQIGKRRIGYERLFSGVNHSKNGYLSLGDIADAFGVTREWIRQLEARAYRKIRGEGC